MDGVACSILDRDGAYCSCHVMESALRCHWMACDGVGCHGSVPDLQRDGSVMVRRWVGDGSVLGREVHDVLKV